MNSYQRFLSKANPQDKNLQKKNYSGTQNTILKLKNSILNQRADQKMTKNPEQPSTWITKASK
jgi:hypothetical protein